MNHRIYALMEILRDACLVVIFVIQFLQKNYQIIICYLHIFISEPERIRYGHTIVTACMATRRSWNGKLLQMERELKVEARQKN